MKKEKLKIGDVAKELNIKKSLLRQWESEFQLGTKGQNSYSMEDMEVFVHIKELVRTKGLSVDQAKVELEKKLPELNAIPAQKMVEVKEQPLLEAKPQEAIEEKPELTIELQKLEAVPEEITPITEDFNKQIISLKADLLKLKRLLG